MKNVFSFFSEKTTVLLSFAILFTLIFATATAPQLGKALPLKPPKPPPPAVEPAFEGKVAPEVVAALHRQVTTHSYLAAAETSMGTEC